MYQPDKNLHWSWVNVETDFITYKKAPTCGTFEDKKYGNSIVIFMDGGTHVLHLEHCILHEEKCISVYE